eukprot:TRINITY_DN19723_c0_g1_i2.p1 TRINITY_DN19723_c0_g1~~TRINITY_DN19723_c0_g1_i2.p1  ORF type:complete len:513 (+),score=103.94 TRINITY_DN19723_c0_g1_i2:117-1655(+)
MCIRDRFVSMVVQRSPRKGGIPEGRCPLSPSNASTVLSLGDTPDRPTVDGQPFNLTFSPEEDDYGSPLDRYRAWAQQWLVATRYKREECTEGWYAACAAKYEQAWLEYQKHQNSGAQDCLQDELQQALAEIDLDLLHISDDLKHLNFNFGTGSDNFIAKLRRVLGLYAVRSQEPALMDRTVGYYRGMHLIAMLLLKLYPDEDSEAFQVLCALVEDLFTAGTGPFPNMLVANQIIADHEVLVARAHRELDLGAAPEEGSSASAVHLSLQLLLPRMLSSATVGVTALEVTMGLWNCLLGDCMQWSKNACSNGHLAAQSCCVLALINCCKSKVAAASESARMKKLRSSTNSRNRSSTNQSNQSYRFESDFWMSETRLVDDAIRKGFEGACRDEFLASFDSILRAELLLGASWHQALDEEEDRLHTHCRDVQEHLSNLSDLILLSVSWCVGVVDTCRFLSLCCCTPPCPVSCRTTTVPWSPLLTLLSSSKCVAKYSYFQRTSGTSFDSRIRTAGSH